MLPLILFIMLLGSHVTHAMERPTKKLKSKTTQNMLSIKDHNEAVTLSARFQQRLLNQALLLRSRQMFYDATDHIKQLLVAGADPNVSDETNETPLTLACRFGNEERVRALLDAGAHPNGIDPEKTPLHAAVKTKTEEGKDYRFNIIRLLITRGADKTSGTELTPLRHAVEQNDNASCEAIIYTPSAQNAQLPIQQGLDNEIEELKQQFKATYNGMSLYKCARGQGYLVADLIRYKKLIEIRGYLRTYLLHVAK